MSTSNSWPTDARRDRLIGDWHIYQRTGGHRTSTDDLVTAWYAIHRNPARPGRYLDLGCGIGSVLLMVCHKRTPNVAVGIEAQGQSVEMARRAVSELPGTPVIEIRHGDLREAVDGEFDLITGSPPYFPPSSGVLPKDPQRLACRFEMRGGVEGYLESAARALAPAARFYLVFQTVAAQRVLSSARDHGLHLTGRADFQMTTTRTDPFLTVFEFALSPAETVHAFRCAVRDENRQLTPEYQAIRAELGLT